MIGIQNVINMPIWYRFVSLAVLFLFAFYDYKHHLVRNNALIAFLPWCLSSIFCNKLQPIQLTLLSALLGFMTGGLLLLIVAVKTHGGIGGGDIKLISLLGIIYGPYEILSLIFLATLIAILESTILNKFYHIRNKRIPFVPYIFAAALIFILLN